MYTRPATGVAKPSSKSLASAGQKRMFVRPPPWTPTTAAARPNTWKERFHTQPPPGSNFSDCKCARIETKAYIHHPLWVAMYESFFRRPRALRSARACHRSPREPAPGAPPPRPPRGASGGPLPGRGRCACPDQA